MNDELKQRISRIKRIISCFTRYFLSNDYAVQCRDARCGVRDTVLIASVEDAWRIEDATLFERYYVCNLETLIGGATPSR